jgi:hypothetical protein
VADPERGTLVARGVLVLAACSDRPGATEDTSAAKPAVKAAAPAIIHRRRRPIRTSAASR